MTYKRVIITQFGPPDVLEVIEEANLPQPGPDQVRVKVQAAGAAFTDTMIRKGKYPDVKQKPPFTPGYDMVGVVDKLGDGVKGLEVGQRVAALTVIGSYAEYMRLPVERVVVVPAAIDPAEAVSLVLSYVTAYQMLHRVAKVHAGEKILVHGAGGGVGTALLQLGRLLDLEMYGTEVISKHELISNLGATPIDYKSEDFVERVISETGGGVDAVFDHIGGSHFKRSLDTLAPGGTLVGYGFYNAVMGKGGSIPVDFLRLKVWDLLPNGRAATFYSIAPWREKHPDWFREDLTHLFELLSQEKIAPHIWKRVGLNDVIQAHKWIEQAVPQGKIVLDLG